MAKDRPTLDLTGCDREPIHIPGRIQSFGYLVACEPDTWSIAHVSKNAEPILGVAPEQAIGQSLKTIIGRDASHSLVNALSASAPGLPGRVFDVSLANGARVNAAIHSHAGFIIVEFEPFQLGHDSAVLFFLVRSMMMRLQEAKNVGQACEIAAHQVRALIDFDRVLIYRFLPDGSGSVIAESRIDTAPSFLEHHFPATDIPQPARQLYLKNWIRLIADVEAEPVPVLGPSAAAAPLDMTYAGLRAISPIHIEYLRNMGLRASLSISIVVGGALWGLIACHNSSPRTVLPDTRVAAEIFGQSFSLFLQTLARADAAQQLRAAREQIEKIVSGLPVGVSLSTSLGSRMAELSHIVGSDGVALWFDRKLITFGAVPPDDEIPKIAEAVIAARPSGLFATQELRSIHPPAATYAAQASGIIALQLSRTPGDFLFFFRREFVRTISWAGNPEKSVEIDPAREKLSPRRSFEVWRQEVKYQSRPWDAHSTLTCEALRTALLEIVLKYNEILAAERAKTAMLQQLHKAEFSHRVKNALSLINALLAQSREQNDTLQSFVSDLERRIHSLALAHDLASRPGRLSLRHLIEAEIKPFRDASGRRFDLKGPNVWLGEGASQVLALVFHELATNASKHGALSVPGGAIAIHWHLVEDNGCHITWRERGGPPVRAPKSMGFGMRLISRQIPFELGGRSEITYAPDGLQADFWLPAASIEVTGAEEPAERSNPSVEPPTLDIEGRLAGRRVLLLEDSLIVALELERTIRRLGATEVSVCGTLAEGLDLARSAPFEIAVLDVNIKGDWSYAVADCLAERGIPFVFITGYGRELTPPERFADVPVISKPGTDADIARAITLSLNVRASRRGRGPRPEG